ncbi:hypothetical protein [Priestia megaterium]|uniref:hypothetical protein n=1 Tax=Priestia megaterium TaxID=1404 RepID=UPI003672B2C7
MIYSLISPARNLGLEIDILMVSDASILLGIAVVMIALTIVYFTVQSKKEHKTEEEITA